MTWENRLIFEVSSADPDSDTPVWVDLTSRVNDMAQLVDLGIGRQNDLDETQPAQVTLVLNNADDALTYGNTSSVYPWWGPGRKCRLRENISGTIVPLLVGFLQVPTEVVNLSAIDQRVTISVVDRLGRLQVSEPFISTLAAHIRYVGSSSGLKFYAPLTGPPWGDVIGGLLRDESTGAVTSGVGVNLSTASGPIAYADDVSSVAQLTATGTGGISSEILWSPGTNTIPVSVAGQVVTACAWVKPVAGITATGLQVVLQESGPSGFTNALAGAGGGVWRAQSLFTMTSTITTAKTAGSDPATLLGLRFGYNPPVFELWVNDQRFIGSLTGTPPASAYVRTIYTPINGFQGSISHAQLYVGQPTDFDWPQFQAQYQMGLLGLERQLTGDRIRTMAQYAGIPNAEIANTVDPGQSVMQRATLAGRTPLDAMREAETTEQGLLYVDGSGNLVFKDRRTLYNI